MKKLLIISNMYPSEEYPAFGSFVKQFYDISTDFFDVKLVTITKKTNIFLKMLDYMILYIRIVINILFFKYDFVYVHFLSHVGLPVLICRKIKKFNLIVNAHGSDVLPIKKTGVLMQRITKKMVIISNKIVVPSSYFKEVVSEKYSIGLNKIFVYPSGGVSPNVFYPFNDKEKELIYKNLNLKHFNYFCFASRIDDGKGWEVLIEAIFLLKKENLSFFEKNKFFMIGSGSKENELDELIKKYELSKYIIRTKSLSREQLAKYFNISKWFIFPTYLQESLGLVGLEAMATATPIIVSDYAGPSTYIKNLKNGLTFEVKNSIDLKNKLIEAASINNEQYLKMCESALETARDFFPESIKNKFMDIFDENNCW